MARTTITAEKFPGEVDYNGLVLTMTAADTANQNQAKWASGMTLLAHNSGITGRTVTVTSSLDILGRTKDITGVAIAADEILIFGPFTSPDGWKSADGFLYFEANHVEVEFSVLNK